VVPEEGWEEAEARRCGSTALAVL
jgi:hypothetical protein